jgi:hypothetical protein
MVAPKTLGAATRRLDVGAGGFTDGFSDFQFALPAKLTIVGGDGQVGAPGSALPINPSVSVTDVAGDPVPNATVRFAASAAACAALNVGGTVSGTGGIVTDAPWVIASGANTRVACGRGLAGSDFNGPRTGVDPFQALSVHFGDLSNGPAIDLRTGSVQFTATGIVLPATLVPFGSGGYSSYGPYGAVSAGPPTSGPPSGWPSPAPATSSTIGSQSPFLGLYSGCSLTSGFNGTASFPENTDVFVTKSIVVPAAGTLTATIFIDNDVRVWVDGVERTNSVPASSAGAFNATSQFWQHEGCADVGPAVLSIPVTAGTHSLSLWARDRGAVGYLDVKIVLNP